MNGLIDYGSDSDSQIEIPLQQPNSCAPDKRNDDPATNNGGVNVLQSYYDSSEDEEENETKVSSKLCHRSKRQRGTIPITHNKTLENRNGAQPDEKPPTLASFLPVPPTINTSQDDTQTFSPFMSLVLFDQDYLTCEIQRYHDTLQSCPLDTVKMEKQNQLQEKLNQMYHNFYGDDTQSKPTTQSFSHHLKQQREFRNPAMFQSIIGEFGIDPFGTNLPPECWNPRVDFSSSDFYDQINKKEEENRIRSLGSHEPGI